MQKYSFVRALLICADLLCHYGGWKPSMVMLIPLCLYCQMDRITKNTDRVAGIKQSHFRQVLVGKSLFFHCWVYRLTTQITLSQALSVPLYHTLEQIGIVIHSISHSSRDRIVPSVVRFLSIWKLHLRCNLLPNRWSCWKNRWANRTSGSIELIMWRWTNCLQHLSWFLYILSVAATDWVGTRNDTSWTVVVI